MQLELDSAEKLRANWPFLTAENLAELLENKVISSKVQFTNNQNGLGGNYTGEAAIRRVYVFGDSNDSADILGIEHDWIRVDNIAPGIVFQTVGLGIQVEPRIVDALKETNGGVFPPIIPPTAPE